MTRLLRAAAVLAAFSLFVPAVLMPVAGRAQGAGSQGTGSVGTGSVGAPAAPASAPPPLGLELNKLEPLPAAQGGAPGCRVYMVATNPGAAAIEALRLDLVVFSTDGVISHRVAVDLGPLPPHKTSVRLFDLAAQNCDEIGRMLVNDVMQCQVAGAEGTPDQQRQTCLDRLATSSRTKASLSK